jgi:hypothetical protein
MLEGLDTECDMVVAGVFDGAWVVGMAGVGGAEDEVDWVAAGAEDGEVDVGVVEEDDAGIGVDEAEGMGADVGTGAGTVGKEGDKDKETDGGASREAEDVDAGDRVEVGGVD